MPYLKNPPLMYSLPTPMNMAPAMAGLAWGGRRGLGETIQVTGGEADLAIAKLQLAINRVIRGARVDENLAFPLRDAAKAATMVKENGVLGALTAAAFNSAKLVTGVSEPAQLTTRAQIDLATKNLNAAADGRGYGAPDSVVLAASAVSRTIASLFGGGEQAKGSFSTTTILIGVGAIGLGVAVAVMRKPRSNPRRQRSRR